MRAVDAVMECLKAEGVEVVFGYPGGANLPTYDAFVDAGIKHVLVRHEQGGGHAAEGYARATGKVGVALGTSGPGATNLVTAITDAMMDSTPVVFLTGQVRTDLLGHGRLPGGRHARHHDADREAQLHDPAPQRDPARDPRGLPHRPHRPSRPGRGRHPDRPVACGHRLRARDRPAAARLSADDRGQPEADPPGGQGAGLGATPGDLRGRRRGQRQRGRGAHRARRAPTASRSPAR